MANLTESQIGSRAERMVKTSLLSEIRSSGLKLSDAPITRKSKKLQPLTPLKHSDAFKRMVKDEEKLFGIAVHMGKHGFVHTHGANVTRKATVLTSKKNKVFTRKAHRFSLPARRLINKAVARSGAVPYLSQKISAVRGEEIVSQIKGVFRNG